jgi:hypothetical protein
MEGKGKLEKASFLTILWAILVVVLFVVPCSAVDVYDGQILDLYSAIDFLNVWEGGTANLFPGAHVEYGIYALDGSVVNIRGGTIGGGFAISVYAGPPVATVTVYGTDFEVSSGTIVDGSWTPDGGSGTLIGEYEDGDPEDPEDDINLLFYSDVPILLVPPDTTNLPPEAIAGQEGLIGPGGKIHPISSSEQSTTSVLGQASDPEEEPIEYRWLEGETVLLGWTTVSTPPQAYLDLSTLPPFSVGDHTLTLEVRETTGDMLEASDDMTLRILAAPEITEITIEPTPIGSPTTVTAMFTDADSGTHTATIVWEEGGTPESGVVNEAEMTVTGSHTYTETGVYTVTVTVTDQNGGTASRTAYAAVYDPDTCNLVTGAGWFPEEQSPCGQALFGFIVRQWGYYPAGLMYFRWGDNQFQATEVDWLVISDDENSAWFFGVGTINGTGEYYFMVEICENPDSIWITIWDEYDNGGLIGLTGGRIRIRQWGG